jgi:hypothetical protein
MESDKRGENQAIIEHLKGRLEAGESINAFLSSSVQRIPRPRKGNVVPRDQLLAEWGIHHLHLSDQISRDGFVKRTEDVLFAIFKDDAAYLIGIYGHPGADNWARQEIFAILVRNWPDRSLVAEMKGVIGLTQQYDDDDRAKLRKPVSLGRWKWTGRSTLRWRALGKPPLARRSRRQWECRG